MQVIAMHGWCGDSRSWAPWEQAAQRLGWAWHSGERGYGSLTPQTPAWQPGLGTRVVIAHSLGPHLLERELLAAADAIVLLASFGRFVPPGAAGRGLRTGLKGMAAELAGPDSRAMLTSFMARAAAPQSGELIAASVLDTSLKPQGVQRLRDDLELLSQTTGLPAGFPGSARVLLVQAGADQIVVPEARLDLQELLPGADLLTLAQAGHALLATPVVAMVLAWLSQANDA